MLPYFLADGAVAVDAEDGRILGRGYRLDHGPSVIEMSKGCDGQILHGGAHERFTNGGFMEGCECSPPTWLLTEMLTLRPSSGRFFVGRHVSCGALFHGIDRR